ncbi:diacylglycerol/lipid kinase family protein [Litchfieldella xinjiangensis]|uniref:diacylglycerol/lipid kinase family protein n=1 Tax=Litchfieldella xinjiangensis TaxID=1166948 RepID=UPI0005BC03DF|nr:diacylglycerol kinase family protein [Halomonas xinjiangensis]
MTDWLIANAKAGDGARDKAFWQAHLEAVGIDNLRVETLGDDAWHRDVQAGDRVMVAGGDGSVSAMAALCMKRKAILGVLPSGTANDFARNLDLPDDPTELCRVIASGHTVDVDVATFDDHIFLNVAHIGLGTLPSSEASHEDKKRFGRFSYLALMARRVSSQRGFHARIVYDDTVIEERWLSIAVSSGAFFGGGQTVPQAIINDGNLDIVLVRPSSVPHLLFSFVATRLMGHTPKHDKSITHIKTPSCRIELRHEKTLSVDGDILGKVPSFAAACRHEVLRVAAERVVGG